LGRRKQRKKRAGKEGERGSRGTLTFSAGGTLGRIIRLDESTGKFFIKRKERGVKEKGVGESDASRKPEETKRLSSENRVWGGGGGFS